MTADRALVNRVRRALAAAAEPERADGMRRYMKSALPFYGVSAPRRRAVLNDVFAGVSFATRDEWSDTIAVLFDDARFREEWYAGVAVSGLRVARTFWTPEALATYEHMIVVSSWWDVVDEVASHRIGDLVARYPETAEVMRVWARDEHMWKRRTAIICQLRRKDETDRSLLADCIDANLDDPDFFIRKAIGWALRALAWTDLDVVERFVAERGDVLSPLSRREALKNAAKIRARG